MTFRPAPLLALVLLAIALIGQGFSVPDARAAASEWLDHEQSKVRLIASRQATGDSDRITLGLQFQLQPGWKIYWRSPGDAGFPPRLDWAQSQNLAEAEMLWPVPERFSLFGLETFGYGDEIVLPIEAAIVDTGAPLALRARLTYLICEEICIPYDGELALDLPGGPGGSARENLLIESFLAKVPGFGAEAGLTLESALLFADAEGGTEMPVLEVLLRSDQPLSAPDLLVEGPPGWTFGKPEVHLEEEGRLARLQVASVKGRLAEGVLEGKQLTVTATDGRRGLESRVVSRFGEGVAVPLGGAPLAATTGFSFLTILGLALLGGLILNLMPCVLPVLSIKLLSVVGQGGRESGPVRVGFLASAAGILVSFLGLAAVAIALKAGGMAAGWGIQFQQPLFLAAMTAIVTLFACNLFGFFEIPLPRFLAGLGAPAGEAGGEHSLLGHFSSGAFATLLATPCSAPFLGTAVGFALASGPLVIMAVFLALGLGLALPYLAIAAFPGLATRLPRPGPWMVHLRRVLGLALVATAIWLLSVMARQIGWTGALASGALLLLVGLLLAGASRGLAARLPRALPLGLVSAVSLAAVLLPIGFETRNSVAANAYDETLWQPLERDGIAALVAEGQVVFVDVTADWCITCKVNKTLVLDRTAVSDRLTEEQVVAMRGDWTLPDPAITDYLASFGRYGIPFNAVYGPGLPQGEALPELLSEEAVLDALRRAEGN